MIDIETLTEEEFLELAKKQCILYPDLLEITDEESILDSFYDHFKRKKI